MRNDTECPELPDLPELPPGATMPPRFDRLVDYLTYNASTRPDAEALVDGNERLTWSEALARCDRYAAALLAAGVCPGERVAVWSVPRIDALLLYFACMRMGAVFVALDPRHSTKEAAFILGDAEPTILFHIRAFEGRDYEADLRSMNLSIPTFALDAKSGSATGSEFERFVEAGVEAASVAALELGFGSRAGAGAAKPADPVALVYTSGSTGRPKGALITQYGLAHNYWWILSERYCNPLRMLAHSPMNHIALLGDTVALAIVAGGTLIVFERFDPMAAFTAIERESLTYVKGSPTHYLLMIEAAGERPDVDLSSLQYVYCGGAAISASLLDVIEGWCPQVGTDYGMTEMIGSATFVRAGDTREQKLRTIGRPIGPYRARVADAAGEERPDGEVGEFQTHGPWQTPGYFRRDEATVELFTPDGWLRSGDLCRRRPDGFLELAGRAKEMFKSGGYNVYPREVELALEDNPEVSMAVVVEIPDPKWSEVGVAFVALTAGSEATPEELRRECRARLANYKVPKQVVILDEVPRLSVGKVDRNGLRARARERFAPGKPPAA